MKKLPVFRIVFLAASFLLASFAPAFAGNGQKKPKHRTGPLSCSVNASAGKRAATRTTQIRKKKQPAKVKPAKNIERRHSDTSSRNKSKSSTQRGSKNRSLSGNQRGGGFSGGGNDGGNFPQQRSVPRSKN